MRKGAFLLFAGVGLVRSTEPSECAQVRAAMEDLLQSGCDIESAVCEAPPSTTTSTTKSNSPSTTPGTTSTSSSNAHSTTASSTPATTTSSSAAEQPPGESGCWKYTWWENSCDDQCNEDLGMGQSGCACYGDYGCYYGTQEDCRASLDGTACNGGGGGGGGGGSTGGCSDDLKCPDNTLDAEFVGTRPTFRGPNCYDQQYGPNFGPEWKPTGKTVVEKIFKDPTTFYKAVQITEDGQTPLLYHWNTGINSCSAATVVFENWVCSIEYLMDNDMTFDLGGKIAEFGNTGDETMDLIEVVSFISHKFKETGALCAWEEAGTGYRDETNTDWPAQPGASYHGRGPVQLSWNYNYGPFSEWIFGDKMKLLSDPNIVDPEGPMGFIAAFWFWFTRRDFTSGMPLQGTMRTRDAIVHWTDNGMQAIYDDPKYDQYSGLALSTNVINGGIECSGWAESSMWRVIYFLHVASRVGLLEKGLVIPGPDNKQECLDDDFCNGFFRGCTASQGGLTCTPTENSCGPSYVTYWNQHVCTW